MTADHHGAPSGDSEAPEIAQLRAENESLRRERGDFEQQVEALDQKLASLAPHGSCACSYDRPGDVCMHHSPKLATAEADIEKLRTTNRELHRRMQAVEGPLLSRVRRAERAAAFWLKRRRECGHLAHQRRLHVEAAEAALEDSKRRVAEMETALSWIVEAYPRRGPFDGAVLELTWAELNAMRGVLGLDLFPVPRLRVPSNLIAREDDDGDRR